MTEGLSPTPTVVQTVLLQASTLPAATLDATSVIGVFTPDAAQPFGSALLLSAVSNASSGPAVSSLTATTNASLTAGQTQPGSAKFVYVKMTGTAAGASTLTLPTVAALVTALGSSFVVGMSWTLRIQNENADAENWTLTTATGWGTITNGAVAQNTWRDFVLTMTSATVGTVVDVGSGVSP
jgi:hypothetical protein